MPLDPPTRPRARHRRPRDLGERADRWWRRLLATAVAIFAACGPVHALGHTDLVFYAVLVGLALSTLAVPLGLVALRWQPAPEESPGSARWSPGRSV